MTRRVLVTGAGGGIGQATVARLRAAGYLVDIVVNRASSALPDQPSARVFVCDLSREAGVAELIEGIARTENGYYGLIHAAGGTLDSLAVQLSVPRARALFEVHFWAFVSLCKAVAPIMMRARAGRIVAIGSIAAGRGAVGNAAYSAAKAALVGYALSLTMEVARKGVCVNIVEPGYIDTALLKPYAARRDAVSATIPAKRLGDAEEVAGVVEFLLSNAASYVNGCQLRVDGGLAAEIPSAVR